MSNITVSLHEKNNVYQAVINYKDKNNKRKQKWMSTKMKVVKGNKRKALQSWRISKAICRFFLFRRANKQRKWRTDKKICTI